MYICYSKLLSIFVDEFKNLSLDNKYKVFSKVTSIISIYLLICKFGRKWIDTNVQQINFMLFYFWDIVTFVLLSPSWVNVSDKYELSTIRTDKFLSFEMIAFIWLVTNGRSFIQFLPFPDHYYSFENGDAGLDDSASLNVLACDQYDKYYRRSRLLWFVFMVIVYPFSFLNFILP